METIELFITAHPSVFVGIWMKYDYCTMDKISFAVKYLQDIRDSKNRSRREVVKSVIVRLWKTLGTEEKYNVIIKYAKGMHYVDVLNDLLDLQEATSCDLLKNAIHSTYYHSLGRNFDTNYFKAYGLLKHYENGY